MDYVGVDIGSTASKVAVVGEKEILFALPTGWNSKETAREIQNKLEKECGIEVEGADTVVVATGYGRVSVPYASKTVTEITCHARGAAFLTNPAPNTLIDVGGQDTKVITMDGQSVSTFTMNDKCSAGTGKFLEVMANRMGYDFDELFENAAQGKLVQISSMCTVFAESEVIGLMGAGVAREDIAAGVVDSVVQKVCQLARRHGLQGKIMLTGGLSENQIFVDWMARTLGQAVESSRKGRYAGAIGAAILAKQYKSGSK